MELAKSYEKTGNEFFLTVKHFIRTTPRTGVEAFSKWTKDELEMNEKLEKAKEAIYAALCDTRTVLETTRELVSKSKGQHVISMKRFTKNQTIKISVKLPLVPSWTLRILPPETKNCE
jgi:hypothetical protein